MPDHESGLKLQVLLLADHANVRDGLLSVLSAGITRAALPSYPGNLPAYMAMLVMIPADQAELAHEAVIKFKYPDAAVEIARFDLGFRIGSGMAFPGESLLVPLVIPIGVVAFPRPGQVDAQVSLDAQPAGDLSFWLLPVGTPLRPAP